MKRIVFVLLIQLGCFVLNAQDTQPYQAGTPLNHIKTWDVMVPISDGNAVMAQPSQNVKLTTQFFDGLGRPLQTVVKEGSQLTGSTSKQDVVTPVIYDNYGREAYKFLPFVYGEGNGGFKMDPFVQQQVFMQEQFSGQGESHFYAKTEFNGSPFNREIKVLAAGASWAGSERGVQKRMFTNTSIDNIKMWNVSNITFNETFGTYMISTNSVNGNYADGSLYKIITTDEHGSQVIEFYDKEGKLVLKKVQLDKSLSSSDNGAGVGYDGWLSILYIYDLAGRLRCVVQPEGVKLLRQANWVLDATILEHQCFRYEYNNRGLMVMKKIPGASAVSMVYDKRDRLVMTQDGKMQGENSWLVAKYDTYNRLFEIGIWYSVNGLSNHLEAAANSENYPVTSGTYTLLTLTHYDDYSNLPSQLYDYLSTWNSNFSNAYNTWPHPQSPVKVSNIKGKVGWTQSRILGTNNFLYTVTYFDAKDRVIQVQSTNAMGGLDVVSTQYTWVGQPFVIVQRHQKPGSGTASDHIQVTKMLYDDLNRVYSVKMSITSVINGVSKSIPETEIIRNEYDKLGQLKTKKLGKKRITPETYGAIELESLNYDYNLRGWLLGVNRAYASDANTNNYFGFDLGYDKQANNLIGGQTYHSAQYNGNISGMVWKSKGDGEKRKYDFVYDAASRILKADFSQYTSGSFNQDAGVNFNMRMGDGSYLADGITLDPRKAYDDNGNIKQMHQWGLKVTGSVKIDELVYSYKDSEKSNHLKKVTDGIAIDTKLGDFKDGVNGGSDDYDYDVNGNMILDQNKGISSITYNHLNLPQSININGKGTISYVYDAAGIKIQKTTVENNATVKYQDVTYTGVTVTTTTKYMGGAVYETKSYSNSFVQSGMGYTDKFQFIGFEEGRIRPVFETTGALKSLSMDYMLKDHLGNVRMLLTDELKTDIYPVASLETAKVGIEQSFYSIDDNKIIEAGNIIGLPTYSNDNGIGNNPADAGFSSSNSAKLYKLNSGSNKMGLGITLKVMAGDIFEIFGKSYYNQANTGGSGANSSLSVLDFLTAMLSSPTGVTSGGHATATDLNGVGGINIPVNSFLNNTVRDNGIGTRPKAFINYIFFDEQFKPVMGNMGFSPVATSPGLKDHHDELQGIVAQKNGYVYIYVSNESPVDVFFDNLQVSHNRSPILEENHYYPFGMIMKGISSKGVANGNPVNNVKYNNMELQAGEFSDGLGLEMYEYKYRFYDHQIGRFISQDRLADKYHYYTPYQFAGNEVPNAIDLDGLEPARQNGIFSSLWQGCKDAYSTFTNSLSTKSINKTYNDAKGTLNDIGNMAIGRPGAVQSFNQRALNFSLGVSNSVSEPVNFLGTMHTRSANENAYGLGYYGTLFVTFYTLERFTGEISGTKMVVRSYVVDEKFLSGGTKLVSSEMLAKFTTSPTYGSIGGTFIAPTAEINSLLSRGLSRTEIATKLGITDPNFLKGDLIRIDVSFSTLSTLDLRAATGNEAGANTLFKPGGKTSGNITEGIVNGIPKNASGVSSQVVKEKK